MQQLDVFLQSETKSFVDILFKVIDSKEYVNPPEVTASETPQEDVKPKDEKHEDEDKKEEDRILPPDSTTPIREPSPRLKEEPRRKSGGHSPPPLEDRIPRRFQRSSPPPAMTDFVLSVGAPVLLPVSAVVLSRAPHNATALEASPCPLPPAPPGTPPP